MLIRRHLGKHPQMPYNLPCSLSPAARNVFISTYFTKNRKTGSLWIILNFQGSSYYILCSNIKISKRTNDFINFFLKLLIQLICDALKTNFRMTASWFSGVLPVNAYTNSNVYGKDQKKINISSHRV